VLKMDNWAMRMITEHIQNLAENVEIARDKAEVLEEAWNYEIDIEDAFTELYKDMQDIECNGSNRKQLDEVLDQFIKDINDLKRILNLIENDSKVNI